MDTVSHRQTLALESLVDSILSQLDEAYALRKKGHKAGLSLMLLKEMCSALPEFSVALQQCYFETLFAATERCLPEATPDVSEERVAREVQLKRQVLSRLLHHLRAAA